MRQERTWGASSVFGTGFCQSLFQPWGKSSVNVSSVRKNLFLLCSVNLLNLLLISRAFNAYRSYKVKQYWSEALTHLNISVVFKACTCTNISWCLQYPKKKKCAFVLIWRKNGLKSLFFFFVICYPSILFFK